MSDQEQPPPTESSKSTEATQPAAAGLNTGAVIGIVAALAVVCFGAAYAVAGATESDPPPPPTATEVLEASGGAAEIPVLQPTSDGGFVHPDVLAAQIPAELELSDEPPEDGDPVFEVPEGEPEDPDTIIEAPAFEEFPEAALDQGAFVEDEQTAPPAPREPTVVWPGLDESPEPLTLPEEDDIDGSPEVVPYVPTEDGEPPTSTTAVDAVDGPSPTAVLSPFDEIAIESLGFIDPCTESALPDCGTGIGGTIIPTDLELLAMSTVTATPGERCADQVGSVPRDRTVLTIVSNERGQFEVGYSAAGTDDDPAFENITTPESEQEFADRGEPVQTCVVVERIESATRLAVSVRGQPLYDGLEVTWQGLVPLPESGSRPPVSVIPDGARNLIVSVPAGDGETVEVWTIPRSTGATDTSCGELTEIIEAGEATSRGIQRYWEQLRTPLPNFGGWDPAYNSGRGFNVRLFDEDAVDLCVLWYRDLEPNRELVERWSAMILPPAHPEVRLVATGFVDEVGRGGRLHGESYDGVIVDVRSADGHSVCNAGVLRRDFDDSGSGEELFCSFEVTPDRAAAALAIGPVGPPGTPEPAAYRAAVELQSAPCYESDECATTYAAPIPGPPVDGEQTLMGTFEFEIRYSDAPIRGVDWVIMPTGSFDTPEAEGTDHVQLDAGETRVEPDPDNPFRVLLTWQADREVSGATGLGESVTGTPCRSGSNPDARMDNEHTTFEDDHGVIALWVCPGTPYEFTVRLEDEDGTRYEWSPSPTSAGDGEMQREFRWRGGEYRTDEVQLSITADLTVREPAGLQADSRVVPLESIRGTGTRPGDASRWNLWDVRHVWLQMNDESREPEEAYGYYQCGAAHDHDLSVDEPFVISSGPVVEFQLSTKIYQFRACGLFGNVPITAGGPASRWHAGLRRSVPVLDLLEAEDGWRLQDWAFTHPNQHSKCSGNPYYTITDARTGRESAEKAAAFHAWNADVPDTGDPVTDGFCNLPLHYQVRMDIDTQLAGVVHSAVDDVEVAAED